MNSKQIFVRLLNEGIGVFRPVLANRITDRVYRIDIDQNYDSELETWEFVPGELVTVDEDAVSKKIYAKALANLTPQKESDDSD